MAQSMLHILTAVVVALSYLASASVSVALKAGECEDIYSSSCDHEQFCDLEAGPDLLRTKITPKYTVTYFDFSWLVEPIRYLLKYVDQDFEDVRVSWEDWVAGKVNKDQYPYGKLPCLIEKKENGEIVELSQSITIVRYLAKKYNLVGATDVEDAKCEEYADCVKDMLKELESLDTDDEKRKSEVRKNLLEKTFPRYFSVFDKVLAEQQKEHQKSPGEFFPMVGAAITWTDIILAHYTDVFERFLNFNGGPKGEDGQSTLLEKYPSIKAHREGVFGLEKIKKWIQDKPVTEF